MTFSMQYSIDANLLATTTFLEFNHPFLRSPAWKSEHPPEGVEDHLVDSICILAKALRSNLSAYYATIQESCNDDEDEDQIMF